MKATKENIRLAYQLMLGRSPSEDEIAHMQQLQPDLTALRQIFLQSQEFTQRIPKALPGPLDVLYHYYCEFDAAAVIAAHRRTDLQPDPAVAINFIGLKVPPEIHPPVLRARTGMVEAPPNPGNWHADIAEWAAALRTVDLARDTYRIIELGCGWGCWIANMGLVARTRGLKVQLIGVEGDAEHLVNATRVMTLNGFDESEFQLHNAIAGPRLGKAIFPLARAGVTDWNREALFYPDAETLAAAKEDPTVQVLDCLTLEALSDDKVIDLLHIDIQGAETDYVRGNMASLDRLVRRVLIGTHSRIIEGALMAHFLAAGWLLEMERPVIAPLRGGRPVVGIDGVQLWSNPALK